MPRPERGATPAGFRDRLLARLRNVARQRHLSVQRLQQRVAFERLLARLAVSEDWVLKGGFALELRYGWASRPTRDIDLRTTLTPREALDRLRAAITHAGLADHFSFELGETTREMQGAPGGAVRVRVIARVAGITFAEFHVDLSSGDALVGEPDMLVGSDLLSFTGIEPLRFPAYPVTQHLAEKLHAYTLPRAEVNTRVKDFLDLVMIAATELVAGDALMASLHATFDARGTHPLPDTLPEPPVEWSGPFARLASEISAAPSASLREGHILVAHFWDPALAGAAESKRWVPSRRHWQRQSAPQANRRAYLDRSRSRWST